MDRLYLIAYLLPWLIWSSAALGLNLLMGGAGQIHLGYGAVMAIGAYSGVHLVRFGVPLEIAMLVGGIASAVIGVVFGFAALRVKSLYLAMATIAMQYIVDFAITHIPGISGGGMASIVVPPVRFLGVRIEGELPTYYMALLVCALIALFLLNVNRTASAARLPLSARRIMRPKSSASIPSSSSSWRSGPARLSAASSARCWWSAICARVAGAIRSRHSIQVLAMVIVGGLGSVLGSFFGAGLGALCADRVQQSDRLRYARRSASTLSADLRAHLP